MTKRRSYKPQVVQEWRYVTSREALQSAVVPVTMPPVCPTNPAECGQSETAARIALSQSKPKIARELSISLPCALGVTLEGVTTEMMAQEKLGQGSWEMKR